MSARILLAMLMLTLTGCGLRPLYSGGSGGPVATTLNRIEVAPIEGKAGWLLANALNDRLARGGNTPLYRIEVKLDDRLTALGIRRDDTVTRERRTLRARYQLIELAKGTVLLDATAGSDVGIDSVGSDYATIAAEASALERLSEIVADQITARLARFGRSAQAREATAPPPP
ncbi:MAG: LPS assembly lipoprotein LptE [Pseudomonadota bacterium]